MAHFFDLLAHSRHTLGIVGLVMNTLGAFGLIPFPPDLKGVRRDGTLSVPGAMGLIRLIPNGRHVYRIQKIGFFATIALLVVGFFLQLLDLIYVV
jgi:hypothetical protein